MSETKGLHKSAGEWHRCITCPYCGEEDHEHADYPASLRHDGDYSTVTCAECDRAFRVQLSVTYDYQSKPLASA
jgi:transcription elongation factor Elf1